MTTLNTLKTLVAFAAGAAVIVGIEGKLQAKTLTFDDIQTPVDLSSELISDSYGGLNWDNFYVRNTTSDFGSGYQNGTVSNNNVALNGFGDPATVSINNSTFDFDSADLTGAFHSGSILVEGFSNGLLKYSQSVSVNTTTPTLFNFNFFGIDKLEFLGVDGKDTNDTYSNQGKQFALDDFTYNDHAAKSVPEPSAIQALAVLGLGGLLLRRKALTQS